MVEILKLTLINDSLTKQWGHNGYITNQVYEVNATNRPDATIFSLTKIEKKYRKDWKTTFDDIQNYNEIIKEGHSFGAFESHQFVGMIICNARTWNNTLHVETILVSEKPRRKNIGQKLIENVKRHSKVNKFRLVELETQNTNVPAIDFYLKQGFNITGINLKLYNTEKEIAFFMTYENGV